MFIDRVKIKVRGGGGGNGVTAFRREKFVPRGGPSGGDGGRGGDVWLVADSSLNTLLHLRYNPEHTAERGRHGEGSNRSGREGSDVEVRVPVGTPAVTGAKVTGTVVDHGRGTKVIVFKKKRRKQYKRTQGHRQNYTTVKIDSIG